MCMGLKLGEETEAGVMRNRALQRKVIGSRADRDPQLIENVSRQTLSRNVCA
jgi:hypothetical protein